MEELIKKANNAVTKKKIWIKKWKIGHSRGWDKDCTNKERHARKA